MGSPDNSAAGLQKLILSSKKLLPRLRQGIYGFAAIRPIQAGAAASSGDNPLRTASATPLNSSFMLA